MSDAEQSGTDDALVGVPGLPPLADLPRPAPAPSDDELWAAATGHLVDGPDLGQPLRWLVVLVAVADVLLLVIALLIMLAA